MSDYTDFVEALAAVAQAWNDPGPHPIYHREWQKKLMVEWPTLAAAVAKLAEYDLEVVAPGRERAGKAFGLMTTEEGN